MRYLHRYIYVFFLVILVMSSSAVISPARATTGSDIDFITPKPTGNTIYDSWSPDGVNFYFAGDGGTILHYDGDSFTVMDTPTGCALYGISGTSASDIWAVGGAYYGFTSTQESRSVILHYDGSQWTKQTPPTDSFGQYHVFTDVWCDGSGAVWAVADYTTLIAKKTGANWSFEDTGLSLSNYGFHAIYGFSPTNIYAVGGCGQIIHYTGTWQLERMEEGGCSSISTDILYDVWGPDSSNVFVTGNSSQALKRGDDGTWNAIYAGGLFNNSAKTSICGTSDTDIYFSGYAGEIDHWDGSSYSRILGSGSDRTQYTMLRQSAGTYLLGMDYGKITSFNGATRTVKTTPVVKDESWKYVQRAKQVWLCKSDMDSGDLIYGWDGKTLTTLNPGVTSQLRITSFRVFGETDMVLAGYGLVTPDIFAKRYNGSTWTDITTNFGKLLDATTSNLNLFTLLGNTWDNDYDSYLGAPCNSSNVCYSSESFKAMATGDDGTVYAVGKGGAIVAYKDGSWSTEPSNTTKDLIGVAAGGGFVCAAGRDRTLIIKQDGGAWGAVTGLSQLAENAFIGIAYTGNGRFIAALNTGNDGSAKYIGADKGELYEITNGVATLVREGLSSTLRGIGSNADGDIAIAGVGGIILGNPVTPINSNVNLSHIQLLLLLDE